MRNIYGIISILTMNTLYFAQELVSGSAPTNQAAVTSRTGKVIRIPAASLQIGQKKSAEAKATEGLPKLPPPQITVEAVPEGDFQGAMVTTIRSYGWPLIKAKDEFKDGVRTGNIVPMLEIAGKGTAFPVMAEGEDGSRSRMTVTVPVEDLETGEQALRDFNVTATVHVYGKAAESVTKTSKAKAEGAVQRAGARRAA